MQIWQVIATLVGNLLAFWAIIAKSNRDSREDQKSTFKIMWDRIDENRDQTASEMENFRRDVSLQFIKKELYDSDLKHVKEMFERVDKANKEYFALQFERLRELIEKK